jgi:superfamily I DNA/RNA helicase
MPVDAANDQFLRRIPLAKGLEFRAVAVMACDDEILPLQSRLETASDMSDLEEVYNTERRFALSGLHPRAGLFAG